MDQVAVRAVELDGVGADRVGALGGRSECLARAGDIGQRHLDGCGVLTEGRG